MGNGRVGVIVADKDSIQAFHNQLIHEGLIEPPPCEPTSAAMWTQGALTVARCRVALGDLGIYEGDTALTQLFDQLCAKAAQLDRASDV